tara:strand:+ start:417 stop:692 length:276 start_codon:yes stop_codon:yes gene_type:complete
MYNKTQSNIFKQGTKILRSIAEHYDSGGIESPEANDALMLLFGLVAEEKVEALTCDETGAVKWSLTKEYEKHLDSQRQELYRGENILKGPW